MIYNLGGNVVNDAKMLMWCQTTHLYKLTVHFYPPLTVLVEKIIGRLFLYHSLKNNLQGQRFLSKSEFIGLEMYTM